MPIPVTFKDDQPCLSLYDLSDGNGDSDDIEIIENYIYDNLIEDWEENYNKLHDIIDRERSNHVLSNNTLDLYKSLTLFYYYSSSPCLCIDDYQFKIIESGFGCFRTVKSSTSSKLEKIYKDEVILQTLSMNVEALCSAISEKNILVVYINKLFALIALYNFFCDEGELEKEILKIIQRDIRDMLIFDEIAKNYDLPPFCIRSLGIIKSFNEIIPLIKNATLDYTLNEFFNKSSELRPAFFISDDHCKPDIIFFVKFEEVEVPVFIQVKLHYSFKAIMGALSIINSKIFYKDKN
ncbi:2248_t:CDS:2 [Funneliformis caledonium]|uniref:2248_t:CDS:1 n=1 Tax=Funneliformis caledonium TaxID=1117310 RepID=A0A9N9CSR5_9GLOM|nr:2248_t:CDS:2 [Funneliformis caledonium]